MGNFVGQSDLVGFRIVQITLRLVNLLVMNAWKGEDEQAQVCFIWRITNSHEQCMS